MSLKKLMILKALVCLIFGILFIGVPAGLMSIFGASLKEGGIFMARIYAASLFGNLFLCWFTKNSMDSEVGRAIILALFVYDLIGFIITTLTVIAGVLNLAGIFIILIYLFFTLGFGYYIVKSPDIATI